MSTSWLLPADLKRLYHAPETAGTVLEALQQRRDKYQSAVLAAQQENNGSKQRRMGRIVKQYDDAIKGERRMGRIVKQYDDMAPSKVHEHSGDPSRNL